MRKVYIKAKYKSYSKRKQIRLKKRIAKRRKTFFVKIKQRKIARKVFHRKNEKLRKVLKHNQDKGIKKSIIAPKVLNLSHYRQYKQTMIFLDDIHDSLLSGIPIFVDLSNVVSISTCTILYLLSLLDIFSQRRALSASGNAPFSGEALEMFESSGFYKYVSSSHTRKDQNTDVLQVMSGTKVVGKKIKDAINFSKNHGKLNASTKFNLYRVIIECMGNTKNHAYEKRLPYLPKWWLIAQHIGNDIYYCILDNGLSIPKTIFRNWKDKIRPGANDASLITSAFKGDFRSRTRQKERGKGLPAIYKSFTESFIQDLVTVSGKAFVLCDGLDTVEKNLSIPFRGTLFTWKVSFEGEGLN